jgi:hypothetical protein
MDEARRFMRYVIPGLVFALEVCLYLWLSDTEEFVQGLRQWSNNLSVPLTLFLASGGVGFLLSVIYHWIYWTCGPSWLVVNHQSLLRDAVSRGWLELHQRQDGKQVDAKRLTRRDAWRVVTSFWVQRGESSQAISRADSGTDTFASTMHGLGTSLVGSVMAIPVWVLAHHALSGQWPTWYWFIPPMVICFVQCMNFRTTVKHFQSVVDMIVAGELEREFLARGNPGIVHVAQMDVQSKRAVTRS